MVRSKKHPGISLSVSCVYRALGAQTYMLLRQTWRRSLSIDRCTERCRNIKSDSLSAAVERLRMEIKPVFEVNGIELRSSNLDYRWGPPSMVTSWRLNMLLPRHRLDVRTCNFRSATSSGWWIVSSKASFQSVSMPFPCRLLGVWTCHILDIFLAILTLKVVLPRHRFDDLSFRRRRHDIYKYASSNASFWRIRNVYACFFLGIVYAMYMYTHTTPYWGSLYTMYTRFTFTASFWRIYTKYNASFEASCSRIIKLYTSASSWRVHHVYTRRFDAIILALS